RMICGIFPISQRDFFTLQIPPSLWDNPTAMTETLAQRLERLITEAKTSGQRVSMKSLSLAAGQGATYVRDIVKGRSKNPNLSGLAAIAKKLRVPLEELVQPEDMTFIVNDMTQPGAEGGTSADYRIIASAADSLMKTEQ